jgi:hypothetical protein
MKENNKFTLWEYEYQNQDRAIEVKKIEEKDETTDYELKGLTIVIEEDDKSKYELKIEFRNIL